MLGNRGGGQEYIAPKHFTVEGELGRLDPNSSDLSGVLRTVLLGEVGVFSGRDIHSHSVRSGNDFFRGLAFDHNSNPCLFLLKYPF